MTIDQAYNYRVVNERVATAGRFMLSIWNPAEYPGWPEWPDAVQRLSPDTRDIELTTD